MIVVTAPTGQIGSKLVAHLLKQGEAVRVIARDRAKLSGAVRARVEVVQGSHGDPAIVKQAFAGAQAVFWLVPADPAAKTMEAAYLDFSRPACEALRSGDVKHVVGVSTLGRGTPQADHAGYITASLAMDDLIASSSVSYRALANGQFMENLLRQASSIKSQGVFSSTVPADIKAATCATSDVASIAARLLTNRSWSGSGEIPVLGPKDLSFEQMATIMSEVLGQTVRFQQMSDKALKSGLLERGRSEAMAQGMVDMMASIAEGIYSNGARDPEFNSGLVPILGTNG